MPASGRYRSLQPRIALGATYKTAWFMAHRIRLAMSTGELALPRWAVPAPAGVVETDETYFGKARGQGKGAHLSKKRKLVALVERDGAVRSYHVKQVAAKTLRPILEKQIAKFARRMTDSPPVYGKISGAFAKPRNGQSSREGIRSRRRDDQHRGGLLRNHKARHHSAHWKYAPFQNGCRDDGRTLQVNGED